jgi:hypothetical protein
VKLRRAVFLVSTPFFGLALMGGETPTAASGRSQSALPHLARATASQLFEHSADPPVAISVAGPSTELCRAFATLLAGELAQRRLSPIVLEPQTSEPAEDAARREGARSLARLRLSIDQGALNVQGDLLATWVNFWSGRARTRAAHPAAVLQASTQADAEVIALAASAFRSAAGEHGEFQMIGATLARLPLPPAALAAGDLDGDGKDEVLVLTDDEILALDLDGRILARREHRGLPASTTPCREPFGSVAIQGAPPRLAYFSSRRAKGELLELDRAHGTFKVVSTLDDVPLGQLGEQRLNGRFTPGQNTFAWQGLAGEQPPPAVSAFSSFQTPNAFHLLLVFPNGTATLNRSLRGERGSVHLERLGTGSALVDLDGDGTPELVTTSPRFWPNPDELRVLSVVQPDHADAGKPPAPLVRWQGPVPRGRVLQAAAATFNRRGDAKGPQGAVLGVWMPDGTGEIQLYQMGSR